MTDEDRRQIGLTKAGQETVKRLQEDLGWFTELSDVGRFALAYAIRERATPGVTGHVDTRWAPDTFDSEGEIRELIRALFPETTTPVRLIESLIDQGLTMIRERLDNGEDSPLDYLDVGDHESR